MSEPKIKPTDEQVWAAVFAAKFVADAKDRAETKGYGWQEWVGGETDSALGAAEDAATLADWAVAALRKVNRDD